jgi:hypothetical protein
MCNPVDIALCEPPPFFVGVNGYLSVTDGSSVWLIVVTCEALQATASRPERSLKRLLRFADLYVDLAESALARGEDEDGKIWIFERDILASRRTIPPLNVARGSRMI